MKILATILVLPLFTVLPIAVHHTAGSEQPVTAVPTPSQNTTKTSGEQYTIDNGHSSIIFRIKHMNVGYAWGRFNKMKGMGQIVAWSVRDETLHTDSIIRLFRTFVSENPEIWTADFQRELYVACSTVVEHEDAFVNLAFGLGGIEGMGAAEVKQYIRYIADRRLAQLGLQPIYRIEKNPLPWLDEMLNGLEHTNFFENRATEYSRAATQGTWEDVWAD